MTLNISVLTSKCIYQSADYRLTSTQTNTATDFVTQKIFVVNTFTWSATVCFTGVGRTRDIKVHEWVSDQLACIEPSDPFERLIDELLEADSWLTRVPPPHNKHSFSIGAFLGSRPLFVLISNFERPSGLKLGNATKELSVFKQRIKNPTVIVPGQSGAVSRLEKKQLTALAAQDPAPDLMHSLLAEINRKGATRTQNISPACFTTRLRLTGEGDTRAHDVDNVRLPDALPIPKEMRKAMTQIVDRHFGVGQSRLRGTSFIRAGSSEDYHRTQLREKPNDPTAHSNYGNFLIHQKEDMEGAEQQYQMALQLDPNHASALGNLANFLVKKGDLDQAARLYRRAIETHPGAENVIFNFSSVLMDKLDDRATARVVLDQGIAAKPQSGRLLMLRGYLHLGNGDSSKAFG